MTIPVHYLGAKNEANTIVEPDTFITDNDEFYILQIGEPKEIDHSQIEPFGEDENIDDLIQSGHEAE